MWTLVTRLSQASYHERAAALDAYRAGAGPAAVTGDPGSGTPTRAGLRRGAPARGAFPTGAGAQT